MASSAIKFWKRSSHHNAHLEDWLLVLVPDFDVLHFDYDVQVSCLRSLLDRYCDVNVL